MTNGLMEEMKKMNADAFPLSRCEMDDKRSEEDGLTLDDLSGTIYISLFIAAVDLLGVF